MAYVVNQELCSGCHRCRVECPVQAIRFKNSKYWIDPEKCVSCGHCETVCHNEAISDPAAPKTAEPHDLIRKTCDVLVIGAGAAGTAAAAKAAEGGKKVLILEKNKEQGGSAWYAHVFRSLYSKWHAAAGMEDPRDEVYREFMRQTQGRVNGKLVRRILDADTEFVDWLIDEHDLGKDFTFGPQPFGGHGLTCAYDWAYNHKRVDTTIGPGGTGWWMVNKLLGIALDHGAEILYHTTAKQLIPDETGKITKVLASDPGGELEITCESVIICAGAFTRNRKLMDRFNPAFYDNKPGDEPVHIFTCSTCTGDGITMCDAIGADIDYVNARAGMFGPMRHPFGTASIGAACNPYGVKVLPDGGRFIEDGPPSVVSPLAKVPGRCCWHVLDEAGVEQGEKDSMGRAPDVVGINMDAIYANWREELELELAWETMYRADTLPELAEKIGADPEKLQASVDAFNAEVLKQKADAADHPDAERAPFMTPPEKLRTIDKGPYYAVFMKMFHENAIGGVAVDENMNVLRGGRVMPNLYACGDNCRGEMVEGVVGMMYIEGTISALTFALLSGYIAGEEAAAK